MEATNNFEQVQQISNLHANEYKRENTYNINTIHNFYADTSMEANVLDLRKNMTSVADSTLLTEENTARVADNTSKVADNTSKVADNTSKVADNTSKVADNTSKVAATSIETNHILIEMLSVLKRIEAKLN